METSLSIKWKHPVCLCVCELFVQEDIIDTDIEKIMRHHEISSQRATATSVQMQIISTVSYPIIVEITKTAQKKYQTPNHPKILKKYIYIPLRIHCQNQRNPKPR